MIILALDLAWTGPTGWVVWDTDKPDPIFDYGEFKPKVKRALTGARRIEYIVRQIHFQTLNLLRDYLPDVLCYETTDWHQNLKAGDWKKAYARERRNQRALGRAETAVILAAGNEGVSVMSVGAKEARDEFGALRKDAVARLLGAEFDRFTFQPENGHFLIDKLTEETISHHISDAMALAKVAAGRLTLTVSVKESEDGRE